LDTLCEGVSRLNTCYSQFNYCKEDTFYQDTLLSRLAAQYRTHRYAIIGKVDSVRSQTFIETLIISDMPILVPTQVESVWVSVREVLKGEFLPKKFIFKIKSGYDAKDTVIYQTLVDTSFLAHFNSYESLYAMGILPTQDCLYEPTAVLITPSGLVQRGKGLRLPGVSVSLREYLQSVSNSSSTWKEFVLPRDTGSFSAIWKYQGKRLVLPLQYENIRINLVAMDGRVIAQRHLISGETWVIPRNKLSNSVYALYGKNQLGITMSVIDNLPLEIKGKLSSKILVTRSHSCGDGLR